MDSMKLKKLFKKSKVRSIKGIRNGISVVHFIEVRNYSFSPDFRLMVLKSLYGENWGDKTTGGNVRETSITLTPTEWSKLVDLKSQN